MKKKSASQSAFFNPRFLIGFVLSSVGLLLAFGGLCESISGTVATRLMPSTPGTWQATGSLATARFLYTATLLPNGQVLVAGGGANCDFCDPLASAELYDPVSGTWTVTGSLANARKEHTATLLPNGKVLVAGGYNGNVLSSAQLYDPTTGLWTATGSMATARYSHSATLLPNGKVLVAGGWDAFTSAELYDPATGLWTATGSMATGRTSSPATLLPDGQVLIAGGYGTGAAELYDPATGLWTATGSMTSAKDVHTATLLPNGQVLVAGGYSFDGDALAEAELYNPATGLWTATGSMATARYWHTATLLPDGQVLVAAGWNGGGNVASAELYTPGTTNEECVPPPAGLVSWWAGDRTADDVQGTNNGTLVNGTSFTKGIVGPAFLFDGVDDYISVPNNASLNPGTGDFTFEFWIRTTNSGAREAVLEKRPVCGCANFYQIKMNADGTIFSETIQDVNCTNFVTVTSTFPINDGVFHHVALTRQGVNVTLFIDGVQNATGSSPTTCNLSNAAPFIVGRTVCPGERTFNGTIDELTYYTSALSPSAVQAIYTAGAAGKCKPEIFVASITPSYEVVGHGFLVSTSVVIQDENGIGIENASVQVKAIFPSGFILAFPVTTDATGEALIWFAASETGLYRFTVRKVSHPIRVYDRSLNVETTDTLVIP
jgi:hypothetical protein